MNVNKTGALAVLACSLALSCLLTFQKAGNAEASPAKLIKDPGPYASKTPQYRFADNLKEQEDQLENNPLMIRFAESRKKMASDPYRPAYHFVTPESTLNDPNGLTFWQGRWHLFYQAYPPDEFPDAKDAGKRRQHWGHTVSDDLVHWRDLPYAIYPGTEKLVFSGGTVVEKDRVVAFYPGIGTPGKPIPGYWAGTKGQMVAISSDPLLLNWEKSGPLNIDGADDSDIWKEGDTYFGLLGGVDPSYYPEAVVAGENRLPQVVYGSAVAVWPKTALWISKDLIDWKPQGELLFEKTPFTDRFDEAKCPSFLQIGNKHILLFFSHKNGGQYLLGDYDEKNHKFRPYDHGRFNHGQVLPDGVHAPSAAEDGKGGVINILNINAGKPLVEWNQIMSLPQHLTLDGDNRLRIEPHANIESLRAENISVTGTAMPKDEEIVLSNVHGNTMELNLEIDTKDSRQVELNVLRSPAADEQTSIIFYNLHRGGKHYLHGNIDEEISLDGTRSTLSGDVLPRPPERAFVHRDGANLKLRVFIDRSVVEVFVNGRQYLAMRVYPSRKDSLGISLRARGADAILKKLDAWRMNPIWPTALQ